MSVQNTWDITEDEDDIKKPYLGLTDKYINMSINNCCNPWDCLCRECCLKIETTDDNCIDYLFVKIDDEYYVDNRNIIKNYLKLIRNSLSPRDIVRHSTWLWRILVNIEEVLEKDESLRQVVNSELERLSKIAYKPCQIVVKLCRERFSL